MSSYPGSAQSAYASASAAAQAAVQANHHHHHGGVIGNGRPTVPSSVGVQQQQQQQQQQQDCLDYEAKFQVLWEAKRNNWTRNHLPVQNIVGCAAAPSPFSLLFFPFSLLHGLAVKLFFKNFSCFWCDDLMKIFTYTRKKRDQIVSSPAAPSTLDPSNLPTFFPFIIILEWFKKNDFLTTDLKGKKRRPREKQNEKNQKKKQSLGKKKSINNLSILIYCHYVISSRVRHLPCPSSNENWLPPSYFNFFF